MHYELTPFLSFIWYMLETIYRDKTGANQSVALGRAGANVYHAGKIGKDGEWVRKIMQDSGVDTSYIKVSEKEVKIAKSSIRYAI